MYRYWKLEEKQSPWNLMPDTPKGLQQAIRRGAMFTTWMSFSEPVNGGPEPIRYGDFPLDFDAADIADALKDLRTFCLIELPELYEVDPYEIKFYLSGGKGFHAVLPARWFGTQDGDPRLPLVYKKIATQWKEQFNLTTLDLSLYCMRKGKMFRLPNVKRQNGNYKVPLTVDEVLELSAEELMMEIGKSPRSLGDE